MSHINFIKEVVKQPLVSSPRLGIYPIILQDLKMNASLPAQDVLELPILTWIVRPACICGTNSISPSIFR